MDAVTLIGAMSALAAGLCISIGGLDRLLVKETPLLVP